MGPTHRQRNPKRQAARSLLGFAAQLLWKGSQPAAAYLSHRHLRVGVFVTETDTRVRICQRSEIQKGSSPQPIAQQYQVLIATVLTLY